MPPGDICLAAADVAGLSYDEAFGDAAPELEAPLRLRLAHDLIRQVGDDILAGVSSRKGVSAELKSAIAREIDSFLLRPESEAPKVQSTLSVNRSARRQPHRNRSGEFSRSP